MAKDQNNGIILTLIDDYSKEGKINVALSLSTRVEEKGCFS